MKICKDCRFHKYIEQNGKFTNVWYNHFCGASELPQTIDPVTGELAYFSVNDLGNQFSSPYQFRYCRDVNTNGNCDLFNTKIDIVKFQ